MTSEYALAEARANLAAGEQRERLEVLVASMVLVPEPAGDSKLPADIDLTAKDRPILLAAIQARATHLLTGDAAHFRHLFERTVAGVLVLPPAFYLNRAR